MALGKGLLWALFAFAILFLPAAAGAQSSAGIVGVARDTSGAVLPGVTVEAASPALIEKVRTAVTDAQGRFNITDLPPGTYTVTFGLPGFTSYKREGIELTSGFTAPVNGEMKVGSVQETVVVTGATPIVDIQNVKSQAVLKNEVLEALPSGARDLNQLTSLILGATSGNGRNDVGGAQAEAFTSISIHGLRGDDNKVFFDGMPANTAKNNGGGVDRVYKFNTIAVAETVVDTGGAGAETETGGANTNFVPRDGGNMFSVHSVLAYSHPNLSSSVVPSELIARNSAKNVNNIKAVYDYGVGIGGPIVRDKIWFYQSNRFWGSESYAANNYFNASPVFYRYVADLSRPAYSKTQIFDSGVRLTWQITPKQKFATDLHAQRGCDCWTGIALGSRIAPEVDVYRVFGRDGNIPPTVFTPSWSYAANHLLFQVAAGFVRQATDQLNPPTGIGINDVGIGYRWGSADGSATTQGIGDGYGVPQRLNLFTQRATMSYVTGSHAFKAGGTMSEGWSDLAGSIPGGLGYVFRSGSTAQIIQWQTPTSLAGRSRNFALFAQDQWTLNRLTLNLGLRYDHFWSWDLAVNEPAGPFVGARSYPELDDIPNFQDITPRLGAAYDVFGNGKTAIKGSWGRYVISLGMQDARDFAPSAAVQRNTTRNWTDNGNFIPDCDLTNFASNGRNGDVCGAIQQPNFGNPIPALVWQTDQRTGWNKRGYNYQTSVSLQQELRPGLGVTVAYNRTDWKNQYVTLNQALTSADYTSFCIPAPTDPRLGRVSGQSVCGLYDPNKVVAASNVRMLAKDVPGATSQPSEVFNGVDLAFNARLGKPGALLLGGITVGRTVLDYCWLDNLPNVTQSGMPANMPRTNPYCNITPGWWDGVGTTIKLQGVYPLPYDFVVSATFKNQPGIPISASYVYTTAQAKASLGRDLSSCLGAANCTSFGTVQLIPFATAGNTSASQVGNVGSMFDQRLNEVDARLTRKFVIAKLRVTPVAELYNVFNSRPSQQNASTYTPPTGGTWLLPASMLGGRLFKFGAQIDF